MSITPNETPNVRIEDPRIRKVVRSVIDGIGAAAFIAGAIDLAAPGLDFALVTIPVMAGYTAARVVFGFAIDNPNTPSV